MLRRKAVPTLEDLAVGSLKRCQGYKNNACGVDNMMSWNIVTYENRLLITEKFW